MSTLQAPMVGRLAQRIMAVNPHAVFLGSVPKDIDTELTYSYHRSWDDSPHDGGYSVHYWGDAHPHRVDRAFAAAIDIGFGIREDLMIAYTARLHHWMAMRGNPLRAMGVREFAGTLDGREVFAADLTGTPHRTYGWDRSHLTHIHVSIGRRSVNHPRILGLVRLFTP